MARFLFHCAHQQDPPTKKERHIEKESIMESEQQVLIYAPAINKASSAIAGFQKEMENLVMVESMEVCRTITSLSRRLRRFESRPEVVVLLAADKKDLSELLAIRSLFRDLRIILLLPDREPETISKGHTLMPRFLAYCDSNFRDVTAVLNKMLKG